MDVCPPLGKRFCQEFRTRYEIEKRSLLKSSLDYTKLPLSLIQQGAETEVAKKMNRIWQNIKALEFWKEISEPDELDEAA